MAIPIYISRVPRMQPLPPVQMLCPVCHQTTMHQVARHYLSVHVYLIPMASVGTEHHYVCPNCRSARTGPAPAGAPAKPFLHRFGCFVFVLLPLVVLGGYAFIDHWLSARHYAELNAEKEAAMASSNALKAKTQEVVTAARGAKAALDAAQKKCDDAINAALAARPAKTKTIDMRSQKPADAQALIGAGYVILGDTYIPIPQSKYFGRQACFAQAPKELDDAARTGAIGAFVAPETILEQAKALTETAKAMTTPAVFVATDLACPNAKKKCAGAAVWMSTGDKKVLAVVHVEKAVEHGGDKQDRDGLSTLLEQETAKW